jgi:hypothetical protein
MRSSHRRLTVLLSLALSSVMLTLAWSPAARAQDDPERRTESGSLESGDLRLSSGEYHDDFMVEGKAGSLVILDLHSSDFDAFVQMSPRNTTGPNGNKEWHNNDAYKFGTDSGMAVTLPEDGQFDVYVTSATAAETGSYTLGITVLAAPAKSESGKLSDDDRKLDTGEYCDYYDFEAKAGELWVIEVTSADFNTYLFGRSTDDREFRIDNDDTFGDEKHSQVLMNIPRDGKYFVGVTSAQTGETGAYRVTLSSTTAVGPSARPPVQRGITEGAKGLGVQSPSGDAPSSKSAPAPE